MIQTILQWGSGPAILLAITIFLRMYPKEKAVASGSKIGSNLGKLLSTFGNSKIGKKVWNKIEEGPLTTLFAFLIAIINSTEVKMKEDNND